MWQLCPGQDGDTEEEEEGEESGSGSGDGDGGDSEDERRQQRLLEDYSDDDDAAGPDEDNNNEDDDEEWRPDGDDEDAVDREDDFFEIIGIKEAPPAAPAIKRAKAGGMGGCRMGLAVPPVMPSSLGETQPQLPLRLTQLCSAVSSQLEEVSQPLGPICGVPASKARPAPHSSSGGTQVKIESFFRPQPQQGGWAFGTSLGMSGSWVP